MFTKWTKNWEKVVKIVLKKLKKSPPKAAKFFLAPFYIPPFQNLPNISVFDSLTIRFLTRGGVNVKDHSLTLYRSGGPQDRPKLELSKMVQNALYTAPWGKILSFWPFWTSHWAQRVIAAVLGRFATQQILGPEPPNDPKMTQNGPKTWTR